MPRNHRRGPCRFCGKPVGKGKGFAERSGRTGIWLAWHPACDPNPPSAPQPPEPSQPRLPYYVDHDE